MFITSNTETTSPVATSNPPTKINPEQAVAFAALILADDNLAITPEKLQALLKAADITDVEPIWTSLFANALKDKDGGDVARRIGSFEILSSFSINEKVFLPDVAPFAFVMRDRMFELTVPYQFIFPLLKASNTGVDCKPSSVMVLTPSSELLPRSTSRQMRNRKLSWLILALSPCF